MTWGMTASRLPDAVTTGEETADNPALAEAPLLEPQLPALTEPSATEDSISVAESTGRLRWLLPCLAILASLAWLGGMLGLAAPVLRGLSDPIRLTEFIAALCVPLVLIAVLCQLALRTSRAEARRFGSTARAMRAEAEALEQRIALLSHRLAENQASLTEQTQTLVALGDGTVERLTAVGTGMAHEARIIEDSAQTLLTATATAETRVQAILNALPKAHDALSTLAGTVQTTGVTASERIVALDAQLTALAERGRATDQVAGAAAQRLAAYLAQMESTGKAAGTRLEQVTATMSSAVDDVLHRTATAIEESRKGITAQGQAMLAMLNANQATLDKTGRDSIEALATRIASVETTIDRLSSRLAEEQARSDQLVAGLSAGIERTGAELDHLHQRGLEQNQALAASLSVLEGSVGAMTEAMRQGDTTARVVIGTTEHLLTALDAAAREMDETMPEALTRLVSRIGESRQVVAAAKPELLALVTAAESTYDAISAIAAVVQQQRDTLGKTAETLAEMLQGGHDKADALAKILDSTDANARRFVEETEPAMAKALLHIRETAADATQQARETLDLIVPETSRAIEEAADTGFRRAIATGARRQLAALAESSEQAVAAATRAADRLSQQMLTIAQTTAAVEERIDAARAEQEAANSDHFSRRVSLLIEALHSISIDITKTFSEEVSDSAWAAYLKGDRGIFTRRAVRLLDAGQVREIVYLYDSDGNFRERVNRYIHDFEAMLRQILGLRDSSSLGVALLSSDMGKLYVALAQAIERLRT